MYAVGLVFTSRVQQVIREKSTRPADSGCLVNCNICVTVSAASGPEVSGLSLFPCVQYMAHCCTSQRYERDIRLHLAFWNVRLSSGISHFMSNSTQLSSSLLVLRFLKLYCAYGTRVHTKVVYFTCS